ncbi:hypothetical protein D5086_030512 [Populus alba]|uniref:Uncharacterized protein n=1 Tax=Populus alba TaxID=43335 RepID=A0ACC4API0_POPAL
MGRGGRILRALLGAVLFWGVIWFLYVGILPNHATTLMPRIGVPAAGTFQHLKLSGRESHLIRHDMDPNYVSKRRVPNGPDPIHNSMRKRQMLEYTRHYVNIQFLLGFGILGAECSNVFCAT